MKYAVLWVGTAEQQLARLWMEASDKQKRKKIMATQRESIFREFQSTPSDEQAAFCAKIFAQHFDAACRQQAEDGTFPTGRLKKALTALELAIRVDANRKDLWGAFWADMSNIFRELGAEQRRRKKKLRSRKSQL